MKTSMEKFSLIKLPIIDKVIILVSLTSLCLKTKVVAFSEEATPINEFHDHNTRPYYYNTSCFFDLEKNVSGYCHCPNPNKALKNFVCECDIDGKISGNISINKKNKSVAIGKRERYICSCS